VANKLHNETPDARSVQPCVVAETVREMMSAWGAAIEEAGQATAERWASRHASIPVGDGERLLTGLANAVMEEATGTAGRDPELPSRAGRLGERFGLCAFRAGTGLSAVDRAIEDLHDDLFDLCRVAVGKIDQLGTLTTGPLEALELALRLDRVIAEVRRRATEAYAAALADELRLRYRTLRHEMRNSLGTIRTSLALMSDESLPEEARRHPRLRDMLGRNAHFLDTLIVDALSDAAASGVLARIGAARQVPEAVPWVRGGSSDKPRPPSPIEAGHDLGGGDHRPDTQSGIF
jgi:signal transduction histidine kinase